MDQSDHKAVECLKVRCARRLLIRLIKVTEHVMQYRLLQDYYNWYIKEPDGSSFSD